MLLTISEEYRLRRGYLGGRYSRCYNGGMEKRDDAERRAFWRRAETASSPLSPAELLAQVRFDDAGLVPVVVQCAATQAVLMQAWMTAEAITQTLARGEMVYYSRSRGALWHKGETSGHFQKLQSLTVDCDGDCLLAQVVQTGVACHTGRASCFFHPLAKPDSADGAADEPR